MVGALLDSIYGRPSSDHALISVQPPRLYLVNRAHLRRARDRREAENQSMGTGDNCIELCHRRSPLFGISFWGIFVFANMRVSESKQSMAGSSTPLKKRSEERRVGKEC